MKSYLSCRRPHVALLMVAWLLSDSAAAQQDSESDPRVTPIVRVVQGVGPTVVNLYASVEYLRNSWTGYAIAETGSLGAGVIIHPSGIVVTNSHVITANIESSALYNVRGPRHVPARLEHQLGSRQR